MKFVILIVVIACLALALSSDIRMPPTITKSPIERKIYRSDDEITLECEATGSPKPTFEWKKNGHRLQDQGNIYRLAENIIQIKPLTSLDEGYYQCVASNQFGSALSRTTLLQRAVLSPYLPGTPIFESPRIQEGQPYTLHCNPTKCVPKPTYSWAVAKTTVDTTQIPVIPSKRVQIDADGSLHFAYVTLADAQDEKLYKCNLYNPYVDLTMGGSYSKLNVIPSGNIPMSAPMYLFSSSSPVIALEGRNVTLRCFFSGNPEPSLQWSKHQSSLPIGRYSITNFNTDLTIRDVKPSDEGDYYCRAVNTQKGIDHLVQIDVQAEPVFKSIDNRPHNVNVTEGETLEITCKAYAEPEAKVVWMRNGVELDPNKLPAKYRMLDNGKKIQIFDLCKSCDDGTNSGAGDLAVIQCNASNVHGYAFADGYVNVIERTELVIRPEDVHLLYGEGQPAHFNCTGRSDDSTPVSINWYRVRDDSHGDELVYNITDKVLLAENGSLIITIVENTTDSLMYRGKYKCVASNGYSKDEAIVYLDIEDPFIPPPATSALAGLGDWWWIFLIIAIFLLLLILLICCCICIQRNRGDTYPVDQKERKNGNNPAKELADSGFHDYQRPEGEPLKGSRVSLNSSMKMESDEEGSLNEYGDIDAGKFTEDGSFIGDYGNDKRRNFHV